jgi:hypothetical protein
MADVSHGSKKGKARRGHSLSGSKKGQDGKADKKEGKAEKKKQGK